MAEIPVDWESIIYRGVETESLDYKAAQNWLHLSREGKAKFVRHCLALANTKGGYLVVGVGEDEAGKPSRYTGVTPEQAKSFDPTAVGDFVNRFADPAVDFDIVRPTVDGKQYVVFVVRRFSMLPHVCGKGCNSELQQGVFYIRSPEAASRIAYRSSEIHDIVQRALRNQRAMLGRMMKGILYGGREETSADESKRNFAAQQDDSRKAAAGLCPAFRDRDGGCYLEVSVNPSDFARDRFTLSEVRQAVEEAVVAFSGCPFLQSEGMDRSYLTNVSLKFFDTDTGQFWQCFQSGLFHFMETMDRDRPEIEYEQVLRKLAGAAAFIASYYSELGYEDEVLNMRFTCAGVENLHLGGIAAVGRRRKKGGFVCRIPVIDVKKRCSAAEIYGGVPDFAADLVVEVCERFNVPRSRHRDLVDTMRRFLESRSAADEQVIEH